MGSIESTTPAAYHRLLRSELAGFDPAMRDLALEATENGWTARRSSRGHFIMRSPDGVGTISISSGEGRRAFENARSNYRRWARVQPGAAFGLEPRDMHATLTLDLPGLVEGGMHVAVIRAIEDQDGAFRAWADQVMDDEEGDSASAARRMIFVGDSRVDDQMWVIGDRLTRRPVVWAEYLTEADAYTVLGTWFDEEAKKAKAGPRSEPCGLCGDWIPEGQMETHMADEHLPRAVAVVEAILGEQQVVAEAEKAVAEERPNVCPTCGRRFRYPAGLGRHRATTHHVQEPEPEAPAKDDTFTPMSRLEVALYDLTQAMEALPVKIAAVADAATAAKASLQRLAELEQENARLRTQVEKAEAEALRLMEREDAVRRALGTE